MFFHPLWVNFDDSRSPFSIDLIHELQHQTQELLAKGELSTSCQILLVCAALQKRLNDYPAALTTLQRAWTLAELYDLPQVARWAAWGSSALCAQQGQYQQAADHLSWLYVKLKESGDWVLANIVEVIGRTITKNGKENSLVKIAYDWLVHWGESPINIEAGHLRDNVRYHYPKDASIMTSRRFTGAWWRSLLHTLKRIARGDLRLKWNEANGAATSVVIPQSFQPGDANQTIPLLGVTAPASRHPPPGQAVTQKGQPALVVYTLGPFRVFQDEKLITTWPSGKGKAIFKYMVAKFGQPIPKDILIDTFWRDADPEAGRKNLYVAIYGLRQAFKETQPEFSRILFQDDHYFINPEMAVWVDVEEFMQCYQAGQQYERSGKLIEAVREYELAENLYQGDFLEEDLYEDWAILRREGLKDTYFHILDRLSRYYFEEKRYATCIQLCQKILAKDDCREDAHRRLMRCYSQQGQRNLALRQYHLCTEALARVLEVSPMQETETMYHQICNGEIV